ncbi:hypothetical protein O6495_24640, partial [Salmonella enterica subsp. enterica]
MIARQQVEKDTGSEANIRSGILLRKATGGQLRKPYETVSYLLPILSFKIYAGEIVVTDSEIEQPQPRN